jgi:hypothetical protein
MSKLFLRGVVGWCTVSIRSTSGGRRIVTQVTQAAERIL